MEGRIESFVGYYSFLKMNGQLILAFHVKAEGEIIIGEELDSGRSTRWAFFSSER